MHDERMCKSFFVVRISIDFFSVIRLEMKLCHRSIFLNRKKEIFKNNKIVHEKWVKIEYMHEFHGKRKDGGCCEKKNYCQAPFPLSLSYSKNTNYELIRFATYHNVYRCRDCNQGNDGINVK